MLLTTIISLPSFSTYSYHNYINVTFSNESIKNMDRSYKQRICFEMLIFANSIRETYSKHLTRVTQIPTSAYFSLSHGGLFLVILQALAQILLIKYYDRFHFFGNKGKKLCFSLTKISNNLFFRLILYYVGIGVTALVFGYIQISFGVMTAARQTKRIQKQFFHSILSQDTSWFDSCGIGELNTRMTE